MTVQETMPAYTRRHWAKSDWGDHGRIHLLEHHLADVGSCFEALLAQPTIRQRLARTACLADLDDATMARLCVFAALHDIGKVNVGFQTKIWRREDLPGGGRPASFQRVGHTSDLVPVLVGEDNVTGDWFLDALGWDELLGWDSDDGQTVCALFAAAGSHHGEPLNLHDSKSVNPEVWRHFAGLDPEQSVRNIGHLVRNWFPQAFNDDAPPLPSTPAFQHMFLGLCTLADWIGSDERWFEFVDAPDDDYISKIRPKAARAVKDVGMDLAEQRSAFRAVPDFGPLFDIPGSPQPHAIQYQAAQGTPLDEPVVVIESETGSGKTEAALWRFARMYQDGLVDGLYFALPTRSAASQLHQRVNRFISNLFPDGPKPEPVLAVPGYLKAGDFTGQHLSRYEVCWEDHAGHDAVGKFWAAESAKRFLAAQIAVGTVDQAMMGALKVRHAHMRTACLARNLLMIDEVHASDTYMRAIIEALLDAHTDAGGYALLMSATLGSAARQSLLFRGPRRKFQSIPSPDEAEAVPYPAVITSGASGESVSGVSANAGEKRVTVVAAPVMRDFTDVAQRALAAARQGAKVLVIRNTVNFAIETHRALLEEAASAEDKALLFACRGVPTLHHGRFAAEDRKLLDDAVEEQGGRNRDEGGRVAAGTQTLEQSLDIDADLLITDLCPMDVLLQRIGRLHRHDRPLGRPAAFKTATCVVLTPEGEDLSPFLTPGSNRNGLGPGGYVYEDLRILEATRRLVAQFSESGEPWNIPAMNRMLVERATHPHALQALVDSMGERWVEHGKSVQGVTIAEGLTARGAIIRRDCSFLERDVAFGSVEERIRTRLGDEGVTVMFQPPPASPFNPELEIPQLSIPYHLSRGLNPEEPVSTTPTGEGFEFAVQDARFQYDRLGLRRV